MANFMRVGKTTINLDNVTAMDETTHYDKPCVRVHFAGSDDNYFVFFDEDRRALMAFLGRIPSTEDVLAQATLQVANVRVHTDDVSDFSALGVKFFGPDESLRVVFPEGTTQQDVSHFVLPGGSLASVEDGLLSLVVRTW